MTDCFKWLHLTDLHFGHPGQSWMWPRMERVFLDDLTRLHDASGPWDAVLFTGDLTQSGRPQEFAKVTALFDRLWDHLDACGSTPALLAVPGNHDLLRPAADDPRLEYLTSWSDDAALQDAFWTDASHPLRRMIDEACGGYTAWWANDPRRPRNVIDGLLPGDFSATLSKDGLRIGILGLNTTFLQLTGGGYEGRLALHTEQFTAAVPGNNGPTWARRHDACLLLTHHPPGWLTPVARVTHLRTEIAPAGEFAVHLFGHMHEAHHATVREGGGAGRTSWQGPSLFGLESYDAADGPAGRIHGYSAGALEWGSEGVTLTCWPRRLSRLQDGSLRFTASCDYDLVDQMRTRPELVVRSEDADVSTHAAPLLPPDDDVEVQGDFIGGEHGEINVIGRQTLGGSAPSGKTRVKAVFDRTKASGQTNVVGTQHTGGRKPQR